MFVEIKSRLLESEFKELLSYSIFPDESRLIHTINAYQSNDNSEIYAYEVDDVYIGIVGVQMMEGAILEILHLSVQPNFRGLGYGRGLLVELIEMKKPNRLFAETDQDAVDFYRNVGFTVVSLGEKYPGVERFECTYDTHED